MKKTIFVVAAAVGLGLGLGAGTWQKVPDGEKKTVVLLSGEEWKGVKDEMDRRGVCEIKDQNAVLVITNGVPGAEHFVGSLLDEDRNFRRRPSPGRCGHQNGEPLPYDQQSR